MSVEAVVSPAPRQSYFWFGLSAVCAAALYVDLSTDESLWTTTHILPHGADEGALLRLLGQLYLGDWDPGDPDDFKKIIRLLMALGIGPGVIAGVVRIRAQVVEYWSHGLIIPSQSRRKEIVEKIKEYLKKELD